MVNKSQLCDNECLNPIPRGQRRIVPIPESPFVEFTTTTTPPTTTTTTTTTLYPSSLNNKIIYPNEEAPCPVIFPKIVSTSTPPVFGITGGVIRTYSYDGVSYRSHTFNQTSELGVSLLSGDPSAIFTVEVLLVAGGGGGGSYKGIGNGAGGGGAGGFIQTTTKLRTGIYLVIVGDGGSPDQNGQNSSFNQLLAYGGGAGGSFGFPGKDGGSGGGAGQNSLLNGGKGVQGQGFDGGAVTILNFSSGGGGGASESALPITSTYLSSTGGAGKFNNFMDGTFIYYAGGGGGSASLGSLNSSYLGLGGVGGGGSQIFNRDGQANTGGGGAGGVYTNLWPAGKGGSGTVIVRYRI
jgi:hypothetical protein